MNTKEVRLRLGLTQQQFAEKIGVTVSSVYRWERKRQKPSNLSEQAIKLLI